MAHPQFPGFSKKAVAFLKDLEANNSREWFAANKGLYEAELKAPAEILMGSLENGLSQALGHDVSGKIFRLHRDVRFSKDKTPYNSHVRMAFFCDGGKKDGVATGFFLSIEPQKIVLGGGAMGFEGSQLQRFRERVADGGDKKLQAVVKRLETKGFVPHEPELKKIPAGFSGSELLRRKSLTVWQDYKGHKLLSGSEGVGKTLDGLLVLRPLVETLMTI